MRLVGQREFIAGSEGAMADVGSALTAKLPVQRDVERMNGATTTRAADRFVLSDQAADQFSDRCAGGVVVIFQVRGGEHLIAPRTGLPRRRCGQLEDTGPDAHGARQEKGHLSGHF